MTRSERSHELAIEPFLTWLAAQLFPSLPASGEVFDPDRDRQRSSSTVMTGRRREILGRGERLTDHDLRDPATQMISPASASSASTRSSASVTYSSPTFTRSTSPSARHHRDRLAAADDPWRTRTRSQTGRLRGVGVEIGHVRLERMSGSCSGAERVERQVQQRSEVATLGGRIERGESRPCVRVTIGTRSATRRRRGRGTLVHLVDDLIDPGVRTIDLVDDQNTGSRDSSALRSTNPGPRKWPLAGVHQQEHPVDHREPPLDLPPKSAWPGCRRC